MSGPRDQHVRVPAVAGAFYPAIAAQCQSVAAQLLAAARMPGPPGIVGAKGAVVPHAGWVYSGAIAAQAIAAVAAARSDADLVVVFGAVHTPTPIDRGVLDSYSRWAMPGAEVAVVADLRQQLAALVGDFVIDDRFHDREHAVEVELPLIRQAWPAARILAVETPPLAQAEQWGRHVAKAAATQAKSIVYLASSDLTHYGPAYRLTPAGVGAGALAWAKENDARLLQRIVDMNAAAVVPEAAAHYNACGPGAIAAMMAACRENGATGATVLAHRNSWEVRPENRPAANFVGYAAVVVA